MWSNIHEYNLPNILEKVRVTDVIQVNPEAKDTQQA